MACPSQFQHFPDNADQFIDHPSHAKIGIHPFPDKLYVLTTLFNPVRYNSRYFNYKLFERHVESAGAILYTAEIAFGGRCFEITDAENPRHLQLRANDEQEIWLKENSLNLLTHRLPVSARYVAWVDADLNFVRHDWAQETLHLLQHYQFLQMFSRAQDLGPNYEPLSSTPSFVFGEFHDPLEVDETTGKPYSYYYGQQTKDGRWSYRHPGFAWAARRSALDLVGGLIDHTILGSGDWMMAHALFGKVEHTISQGYTDNYKRLAREWQARAERHVQRNVGYMPGTVNHYFHGAKTNRQYNKRWQLLVDCKFDPLTDLKRDTQGLYALEDNDGIEGDRFIKLRDGLRRYARLRDEDNPNI